MSNRALCLVCVISLLTACKSDESGFSPDGTGSITDTGVPADLATSELPFPDASPRAGCGNGICESGENCLDCSRDCDCACGDAVCTHGEFCAICPDDCDCTTLAATPPMGWNSWNLFACDIDEQLIREMADAMVANGMRDAGYRYLNLDDCWQIDRDADGVIVVDPDRFPSGMAALAKYVHESGLLFGLYTCAGTMTCQERPGSYEYEYVDMQTYADWETDFVKVDWCFTDGLDSPERYAVFHDAIAATGREILLSICNWGYADPWVWGPLTGTIWRTSGDIFDHIAGVIINLTTDEPLAAFSSIGHWNDPDMLEVGNGGMTTEQYKAHFALWAILNSPLIAGNDLRDMNQDTRDILLNEELIAVNQDPNGLQGVIVSQKGNAKVYARPLTMDGLRAVVLFNGELENEATLEVKWSDLGLLPGPAEVRDLFAHQDLGPFEGSYSVTLAPTTAAAIRVQGTEALPVSGNHSLTEQTWKYEATPQGHIMRNQNAMGNPLTVAGTHYPAGLGAFGAMRLVIHLASRCTGLTAQVALDDAGGPEGSVTFSVVADGKILFDSGTMTIDSPSQDVQVNLTGKRELTLVVTPAGDSVSGDFANWLNPVLICK